MRFVRVALVLTAVFAAMAPPSASALPASARVTTAGLGAIKIGMTERQVEKAAKRSITREGPPGLDCTTATFGKNLYGLFTGNRLARIYVRSRRYATRSGIRVGATEAQVFAAYRGQVSSRRHQYDPGGHYLEIKDGNRKVVFETDGSRVLQISTGRLPEINYVEGCA